MPCGHRWKGLLLAVALLAPVGCHHAQHLDFGHDPVGHNAVAGIAVPPPGSVPRELEKIVLPPYVIEAPDQLLIEVIIRGQFPELDEKGNEKLDENKKPIYR